MKVKLDENMPADLATLLVKGGHDVHGVLDESLGGSADSVIVEAARREERILMTFDTDFADVRHYHPGLTQESSCSFYETNAGRRCNCPQLGCWSRGSWKISQQAYSNRNQGATTAQQEEVSPDSRGWREVASIRLMDCSAVTLVSFVWVKICSLPQRSALAFH